MFVVPADTEVDVLTYPENLKNPPPLGGLYWYSGSERNYVKLGVLSSHGCGSGFCGGFAGWGRVRGVRAAGG